MSRYSVQYRSTSKGLVNVEDMNDFHLMAAYRKHDAKCAAGDVTGHDFEVHAALVSEMSTRGLDPRYRNGREPAPDAEPRDEGTPDA